jgi:hypothetical protein
MMGGMVNAGMDSVMVQCLWRLTQKERFKTTSKRLRKYMIGLYKDVLILIVMSVLNVRRMNHDGKRNH